ncbi:MAG: YIP1 family protein [Dictyoglomus sp.]|nr:YIP1 family protein [Dictyoglomus sp.]MDW8188235.1 YIP1 family protein [Dictyoglomus sp.]
MKRLLFITLFISLILEITFGGTPYYTYIYNEKRRPVPSLPGFEPEKIITGESIGVNNFSSPQDLFVDKEGNMYIADTGNNRIVIVTSDFKLKKIIDSFNNNGKIDTFNLPTGLFKTDDGKIYIADSEKGRIVVLKEDGSLYKIIGKPEGDVIKTDFVYKPKKLAVDKLGRIYVVAENVVEGLIQFNVEGKFERFFGSNRVEVNPLDLFWRRVLTRRQRQQLALFIPIEYRNVTTDKDGFIYGCVRAYYNQVKRLNALGDNIIKQEGRTGSVYGDLYFGFTIRGEIVDIALDESDNLYVLDGRVGRIFVYNTLGDFLFVIGDLGNQKGQFSYPCAIAVYKNKIYVLDENKATITVFSPTYFGELVLKANSYYVQGYYGKAAEVWKEVVKLDTNYDLAYIGLGKNYLSKEEYKFAMDAFKLGFYPQGYSKALRGYRIEYMRKNFSKIMNALILFFVFIYILIKFWGDKIKEKFKKSLLFYTMFHPFDGFYELKKSKNSFKSSFIILIFLIVSFLIKRIFTSFHFNPERIEELNIILEVSKIVFPLLGWVIINWAITTIMDGKATMKNIWTFTLYSLFPIALFNIPQTLLSHVFTLEEIGFYGIIGTLASLWSLFLLFSGIIVTQDYTLGKALGTSLLTVVGILFVMFIGIVFFGTFQQFLRFIYTLYLEIKYMTL